MPHIKVIEVNARPDIDGCEGLLATVFVNSGDDSRLTPCPMFVTPPSAPLQAGFMRYGSGHTIRPHRHPPQRRTIYDTGEVIIVMKGSVKVDLYTSDGTLQDSQTLKAGDLIILYSGGHALTVLEDNTEMIEVKQGPYDHHKDKIPLPNLLPENSHWNA